MPYLNKTPPNPEPLDCRILNAALDLFVFKGYHNVSVHDVQRKAEVSIGSIYKYFGGKEGIATSLYSRLLSEFEEMIDHIMEQYDGATERCEAIIRQLFEYTETHPHIIAYVLHAKHAEFIPKELPVCNSIAFGKMREVIQQGIDQGEFRKIDLEVVMACVFGGAIRMIQLRLEGVIDKPLIVYVDTVLDSVWLGVSSTQSNRYVE